MSKKRKKGKPKPASPPVSDTEYAARLARGGAALLDALPRAVAHGLCTGEQAETLQSIILVETLNASVAAATGM